MSGSFHARLPLSRSGLDRDHLRRAAGLEAILADPATRVVLMHDGELALATPHTLAIVHPDRVASPRLAFYLGRTLIPAPDAPVGTPIVAYLVDAETRASVGGEWGNLRRLGSLLDDRDAGIFTEALALANWHDASEFSPRSGAPTDVAEAGWVRVDPTTGQQHFPRTDPAVIVAVTDHDDRILLGSNAMWEAQRYSLLAGFVEPGESLEAAMIREVYEESGVLVEDPRYVASQPWPFPASLMLGFEARVAVGTTTLGVPDGEEILDVRWFTREQIADADSGILLPGATSIARALIERWYGGPIDGAPW